nr:RNA-dependent RNA polymerase [Mute swan feces associated partitiviridae M]
MPNNLYVGDPFFDLKDGWTRIQYKFDDEDSQARFRFITNSETGKWIDYDLFHRIKRIMPSLNMKQDMLKTRSKYNPDMLRKHCKAWEVGKQSNNSSNYDKAVMHRAFRNVLAEWQLPTKVKPIALEEVPFKKDTNFGAPTFQNSSKDEHAQERAIKGAKAVLRGKCPQPFAMYHRGKNDEEVRITLAEAKEMFLIAGMFFYPYFSRMKKSNIRYAGGLHRLNTSAKMNEIKWKSRFALSVDYSKYDSSISSLLTSLAFKIVESNFYMTEKERKAWKIYVNYFQRGGMLAPDGYIYYGREHGVPSGSLFTSVIGSIVNCLVIEYFRLRTGAQVTDHIVLGDDCIIGLLNPIPVDTYAQVAKEIGINVGLGDSKLLNADELIYFLGHYWEDGTPRRDVEETIVRLCCPEIIKPWNRAKFGSAEYLVGLFDKIKDYQNDNEWFWSLGNIIIDSFLIPNEPWNWGYVVRRDFYYTNLRLEAKQAAKPTGLARALGEQALPSNSCRIRALV